MQLNLRSLTENRAAFLDAGFELPAFDVAAMKEATRKAPEWVHFGAGNIFRAFPAAGAQRLLDAGLLTTGIIAAEGYDGDIVDKAYAPFDCLNVLAVLKSDGAVDKRVIASVAEALRMDKPADMDALVAAFESDSLKMASFTITEKGYQVRGKDGVLLPFIAADVAGKLEDAASTMGKLTYLLSRRYQKNAAPLALVSMDNCAGNGDRLKEAVLAIAAECGDAGFLSYIESSVSFPWTMIDKITPRPDAVVAKMLAESGFENTDTIITEKNTYTAAFVNAEETEYLVIEDLFPNGRPPLEKAGFYMADRDTVKKVERMKVCTCLNPLHTALAVLGCVMRFPTIYSEMQDENLAELVRRIAYVEGMPVVTDPGILSPMTFAGEVIEKRLANPFMPDTPERIATDTSQKLSIRYGETIKAYAENPDLDPKSLRCIPFVLAAWLRYLTGKDDGMNDFVLSSDPLMAELKPVAAAILENGAIAAAPLLSRADIFGVNLEAVGLSDAVLCWLDKMLAGKGAVRAALVELLER